MSSHAPGKPGARPRWTSAAKTGVGTAISRESHVWFSLSRGILDEIYHPFIDCAITRDFGFMVTGPDGFFSEEKRDTEHEIQPLAAGAPGYRLINTCREGRYRITKTIVTDPRRDVLLQHIRFEAQRGKMADYTLYALLTPHIGNQGRDNDAWTDEFRGIPMLVARRDQTVLALMSSVPWAARSCGYVGESDGWQDLHRHGKMTWHYAEARSGNVALTGAIDLAAANGEVALALGFGRSKDEAGQQARASLLCPFQDIADEFLAGWHSYQKSCRPLRTDEKNGFDMYRVSTSMLKVHESKRFPGGLIASLSRPWGEDRGDRDKAGYHVVWPRDLVEAAGAMVATDRPDVARQILFYLMCNQHADGHWSQNMWLDGSDYLPGIQTDETALPVMLADCLRRRNALDGLEVWPMVRLALQFLIVDGPVTQQDRWEETCGYAVFTLATEIAAMLAGADFAEAAGEGEVAHFLRETAACWNSQLEDWTYVRQTPWAQRAGVEGYYIRIAPPDLLAHDGPAEGTIEIKNQPGGAKAFPAAEIVSVDALALVRFGLRAANDPRILNTVKVIDAALKSETSTGPVWHRYTHDGYGETEDGKPFVKAGIGRGWPLLAGERAHYEIAAGNLEEARRLLSVMGAQTSPGGLLPEQVWDAPDIPEQGLSNGHPSGSGMPLVWAHSEYLKLTRSLEDGRVFDTPPQTYERYVRDKVGSSLVIWRFTDRVRLISPGKRLRIETRAPAQVRWSVDDWNTCREETTRDSRLGVHVTDLPTAALSPGSTVRFTFYWPEARNWEGTNFEVHVGAATAGGAE